MLTLDSGEPLARAITDAIQTGEFDEPKKLLAERPELATEWPQARGARSGAGPR